MAWEMFIDDCLCRITSIPSGGFRLQIFNPNTGTPDRITLPAETSLDSARAVAHKRIVETLRRDSDGHTARIRGRVKWFNVSQGYGFILPANEPGATIARAEIDREPGPNKERDIFVHWSSVLMDGDRQLVEGEPVEFEIRKVDRGLLAANVIKADNPESENFRELLQLRRDRIALAMVDGMIRVVRVTPERKLHYLDSHKRFHGLLYLPRTSVGMYHDAVAELESLISRADIREETLHDFFERYPEFILMDQYKALHSKIALESESSGILVPDFVLEPIGQNNLCDLLELKLPTARVEVLQDRRERFAAAVLEACAQLRTYRDYFDEQANRDRFRERYGLEAFRPRMYVIIGRRGATDALEWRRIEDDLPMLNVKTYDDILERAKHMLAQFGTLRLRDQ